MEVLVYSPEDKKFIGKGKTILISFSIDGMIGFGTELIRTALAKLIQNYFNINSTEPELGNKENNFLRQTTDIYVSNSPKRN